MLLLCIYLPLPAIIIPSAAPLSPVSAVLPNRALPTAAPAGVATAMGNANNSGTGKQLNRRKRKTQGNAVQYAADSFADLQKDNNKALHEISASLMKIAAAMMEAVVVNRRVVELQQEAIGAQRRATEVEERKTIAFETMALLIDVFVKKG